MKTETKNKDYGRAVKLQLLRLDMTQAELAEQIRCSRQYLNRILAGDRSGQKYRARIQELTGVAYAEDAGGQ